MSQVFRKFLKSFVALFSGRYCPYCTSDLENLLNTIPQNLYVAFFGYKTNCPHCGEKIYGSIAIRIYLQPYFCSERPIKTLTIVLIGAFIVCIIALFFIPREKPVSHQTLKSYLS